MNPPIQLILVPQGAEHQAVCRGLRAGFNSPLVLPVPVGPVPIRNRLKALEQDGHFSNQPNVLVMGLCGSLTPHHAVADVVLYQDCIYQPSSPQLPFHNSQPLFFDRPLTTHLQEKLGNQATMVTALTSDRILWSTTEKQALANHADVVDMEGYPTVEFFQQRGIAVATLRVVSDNCHHDLPDLTSAISLEGSLLPGRMAIGMLRRPIGAVRLIRGSLQGLKVLHRVTTALFTG
jgi:hypothetical protein